MSYAPIAVLRRICDSIRSRFLALSLNSAGRCLDCSGHAHGWRCLGNVARLVRARHGWLRLLGWSGDRRSYGWRYNCRWFSGCRWFCRCPLCGGRLVCRCGFVCCCRLVGRDRFICGRGIGCSLLTQAVVLVHSSFLAMLVTVLAVRRRIFSTGLSRVAVTARILPGWCGWFISECITSCQASERKHRADGNGSYDFHCSSSSLSGCCSRFLDSSSARKASISARFSSSVASGNSSFPSFNLATILSSPGFFIDSSLS